MSDTSRSPFMGLKPYSFGDADRFHGRENDRDVVVANLEANRLTLLYGESGVGKTSLLRAGVVPELKDRASRGGPVAFDVEYRDVWTGDVARMLADAIGGRDRAVLVILDHFEEYFLYHPHDEGETGFASQFARAVNDLDRRAHFLVSIREDALAKLDRFEDRIPRLFTDYLRIDPLTRGQAHMAIECSLEADGRAKPESELIDAVLDQVRVGAPLLDDEGVGSVAGDQKDEIEASYLQLVMQRLWEEDADEGELRLATLTRLKGARGILREHLENAMAELSDDKQRDLADRIFLQLVTPSGAKIAHTAKDLAEYAHRPLQDVDDVLRRLTSEARLLRPVTTPGRPEEIRYEIHHEKLAAAVLDWRRQRALRAALKRQERIRKWAPVWVAGGVLATIVTIGSFIFLAATETGAQVQAFYNIFLPVAFVVVAIGLFAYLFLSRWRHAIR